MKLLRLFKVLLTLILIKVYKLKCQFTSLTYWRRFDRLEIGSGPVRRNGWLTLDHCLGVDVVWDLNNKLPFPDNCFQTIYSSHVLEHFSAKQLKFLLSELYRVMKPGGIMLICVPDASKYVDAYFLNDSKDLLKYTPAVISKCRMDYLNYIFYMDGHHHFMFDNENLKWQLEQVGFKDFCLREFDVNLDAAARRYESLYAQCYK